MAKYQIMYWHNIPSQIKARDKEGMVKKMLPDRFRQAIDSAAMAQGKTESDAYLSGWTWGPKEKREGSAEVVAQALVGELDQAFPKSRLRELILAHARSK